MRRVTINNKRGCVRCIIYIKLFHINKLNLFPKGLTQKVAYLTNNRRLVFETQDLIKTTLLYFQLNLLAS